MKTIITRKMHFSAGHRLYDPSYSDEKNRAIFGDCSNPNGHGHNYTLYVSVSGEIDSETGMIINLKELKEIIQKRVIDRVDHKNLNLDVDFLEGIIPTTENVARKIWEILDSAFDGTRLEKIVLQESENNEVTIIR